MSKARMDSLVRTPDGRVTTLGTLAHEGMLTYETCMFQRSAKSAPVRTYWAELRDSDGVSWEIGKLLYLSRTGGDITAEFT